MALLHHKSPECTLAELDLFTLLRRWYCSRAFVVDHAYGSNLPADAGVGLVNYPLNTLFSQCDVTLGDRLISQSSATHPYRAVIETLLNFSDDALKSQFSAGLFYKDTAGAMDLTWPPLTDPTKAS